MVHPRLMKGFKANARRLGFRVQVINACVENECVASLKRFKRRPVPGGGVWRCDPHDGHIVARRWLTVAKW